MTPLLSVSLYRRMGIESRSISGFSKGFSWMPGKKFKPNEKTDHAWTAVKIQGGWCVWRLWRTSTSLGSSKEDLIFQLRYLLDVTWATGYLGNDLKFNWHLDEHYFLTDPRKFIFDHFPITKYQEKDKKWRSWQLLAEDLGLGEFNHLPKGSEWFSWNHYIPFSVMHI